MPGLRYLRDRIIHGEEIVEVSAYRPGSELGRLQLGISALGTVSGLLWAPSLPPPPARILRAPKKAAEFACYESRLAGRDVMHTLDQAIGFLNAEASHASPNR